MSVLVIGAREERLIDDAVEAARKNAIPWDVMKAFADGAPPATLLLKDRDVEPGWFAINVVELEEGGPSVLATPREGK